MGALWESHWRNYNLNVDAASKEAIEDRNYWIAMGYHY